MNLVRQSLVSCCSGGGADWGPETTREDERVLWQLQQHYYKLITMEQTEAEPLDQIPAHKQAVGLSAASSKSHAMIKGT